jgi:DNA-binding NtrC family response regulator
VVPIRVPPLRERVEDIPLLARHFLTTYWTRHRPRVPPPMLSESAVRALCAHQWPGNVRQLQNVIEHAAVLLDPGAEISANDLPLSDGRSPTAGPAAVSLISPLMEEGYHTARDRVVAEFEIQYLTWLVNRAGGNMSKAARIAGVDRTTLYRLMERHGLHRTRNTAWVVERSSDDGDEPGTDESGTPAAEAGAPPAA